MKYYQTEKVNQLKKEIGDRAEMCTQVLDVLAALEYCPKKDGSERDNFLMNFAIRGLGNTLNHRGGNVRPVQISFKTSHDYNSNSDYVYAVDFSTSYFSEEELTKAGFDVSRYYRLSHMDERIPITEEDKKTITPNCTAKALFDFLKTEVMNRYATKLECLRAELNMVESVVAEKIAFANSIKKFISETKEKMPGHSEKYYYSALENFISDEKTFFSLSD